jgi:RNA polymerase sigma-70 factor, ECF subfamily
MAHGVYARGQAREGGASSDEPTAGEEADWVEGIRRGDPAAFEAVVRAYGPWLVRFAYGLVRDARDAEDIVHEVLWRVWHGARAPDSLKAYLITAVRNRAKNLRKWRKTRERYATRVRLERERAPELAGSEDPTELLGAEEEYAERIGALRAAFGQLTERQQTALRLRYEVGLSFPALAPALGVTQSGAEQLMARALQALRRAIASLDGKE